ncbi:LysM peptidoglycan-binding domain-containing protein [Lysobacter pythonis]|uniref:LysM peptidoglycan-binding domain-containing protein n=1 Tax=Solilutibacter pythonis TaxID=2483112 RepID=A0A3M2I3W9_9GAMM|nr:transglycosylase SLT domain-containing protein [Lysobacter pythonis]RMH94773.1 LysM peptidoglycan-binding domain-containing protein [Lysobacter pythonis]
MPPVARVVFSVSPLLLAIAGTLAPPVHAQRVSRAARALLEQAAAAEARFNAAESADERDAAVVALERVIEQCGKQRGCPVPNLMPAYKRMLRADREARAPEALDEGDEDENPINIAGDAVPAEATADALLDERNRRFVQMVKFNPAVQAGIRRWLTDMRPALMESYVNYQYLRPHMAPAFRHAGLPEALLFGIMAKESNGKVHATSRAGAGGPLQFMPATGRRFGLGGDGTGFDTRYDPRMASEAAAAYLLERYAQLNGSIEMSLAAYNGGEGRALRIHNQNGGRNFWDVSVYDQFPAETKDYVPMVIAAAWLYLHPSEYGLRFPRTWGAGRSTQLQLKRATSINELTICLGNARGTNGYQRALRNLNPRYKPGDWLPQGAALTVTHTIASLYGRYCVNGRRAETARQLINSDVSSALVRVGELEQRAVGAVAPSAPAAVVPANPAERPQAPAASAKPVASPRPRPVRDHRVARGETLAGIARRYQCDTKVLAAANGIKGPRYTIRQGQSIRLAGCGK